MAIRAELIHLPRGEENIFSMLRGITHNMAKEFYRPTNVMKPDQYFPWKVWNLPIKTLNTFYGETG
jgi:hypothetical protein